MKRLLVLGALAAALLTSAGAAATPLTKLTITTWLEGGRAGDTYTLTCGPARVTGLPPGRLQPVDACRAVGLIGERWYRPTLSTSVPGCAYVQAPPRVRVVGYRRGRAVRTQAEVGPCERLLVSRATLNRVVVWSPADR